MKKFTENEIREPHYAGNEKLKNSLYDLIEETLTPNIEGIDESKLSVTGKEDLVNEFIKIVENAGIDASIDLFKEIQDRKQAKVEVKLDSLTEAVNQVFEKEAKDKKEKEDSKEDLEKVNKKADKEIEKIEKDVDKDINESKTEDERAMTHFKIDAKDWKEMSDKDKASKIKELPERKGKNNDK